MSEPDLYFVLFFFIFPLRQGREGRGGFALDPLSCNEPGKASSVMCYYYAERVLPTPSCHLTLYDVYIVAF